MSTRPEIDPEIAALLPAQTPEELEKLEASLLRNGCLDKLVVWKEHGIVLDGHTRLRLCAKHDIPYDVVEVSLVSREAALQFVINQQLARRNLTDERKSYLRGKAYLIRRRSVGRPAGSGDSSPTTERKLCHSEPISGSTAQALADKHGVGRETIKRDARFAAVVDTIGARSPEAKAAILGGRSDKTRAEVVAEGHTAPAARRVTRAKPGERFPWADFVKLFDRLVRMTDEIARAHNSRESDEHRRALELLKLYAEQIAAWLRRLELQ